MLDMFQTNSFIDPLSLDFHLPRLVNIATRSDAECSLVKCHGSEYSFVDLICLMLNVSVHNFSHVGTGPPLPGYYQYLFFAGGNMSCSRTKQGDPSWGRTPDL